MITTNQPKCGGRWIFSGVKTSSCIYFFVYITVAILILMSCTRFSSPSNDWDVLIFTQRWPYTSCMDWEEKNPTNHSCRLPTEKDIWTIHGIWPTKFGTIGPTFCNSSLHFNATLLMPIQSNLTEYWVDVEVPSPANSFWRHEWKKHGTCSASISDLSTELGYFKKGLEWLQKYNMKNVLDQGGVHPDSNTPTDLSSIWLAIKSSLEVNPSIHCVHDKKTSQYYINEIRICFDKKLNLVDCDGIKLHHSFNWQPLGNCPNNKPIVYPSSVPPLTRKPIPPPPSTPMANLLNIIGFVMWLTS